MRRWLPRQHQHPAPPPVAHALSCPTQSSPLKWHCVIGRLICGYSACRESMRGAEVERKVGVGR